MKGCFRMRNVYRDVAEKWQMNRQEPATPVAEGIRRFHNDIIRVMRGVTVFVTWMLRMCYAKFQCTVHPT